MRSRSSVQVLLCRRSESAHQRHLRRCRKPMCHAINSARSVDHLLELLHRQRAHRLGRWLCFKDTRLLRKRVDALASCLGWLLLQLHVQRASELELARFLQLRSCKGDHGLGDHLDLTRLEADLLSDDGVRASGGHLAAALHRLALHGSLHCLGLHGRGLLHRKGHCCGLVKKERKKESSEEGGKWLTSE